MAGRIQAPARDASGTLEAKLEALTHDLNLALQQQTATADVLKLISRSAFDLDAVFRNLIETAARLCDASICILFRRDGDVFVPAAGYGVTDEFVSFLKNHPMPFGRGTVAGRAASERMTVHIPDIDADPEYGLPGSPKVGGWRSILGVPLLREGEPLGVLALARPTVGPFAQRQIELVQTFADQAVIAIENVRLFDEVQARTRDLSEALQQQTATADVLKVISRSAFDLDAVFRSLIETAARLCDASRCMLWRRDGDVFRAGAAFGATDEHVAFLQDHPMPFGRGTVVGRAAAERATVHIPDIDADPEYELRASPQIGGWRAILCVPLLREGEPLGVLALSRPTVGPFSQRQIELVQTFADQAVIAIENVRLFDEVRARTRDLSEALQQQTATADVLKVISRSAFDLDTVLGTLARSAATLCNADTGIISLRQGEVFRPGAMFGITPAFHAYLKTMVTRPGRDSVSARVALSGAVEQIVDVQADAEINRPGLRQVTPNRSAIGVPLLREGKVEGIFVLGRTRPEPFTQRQIELVQTFADQAVIAIENVRLFEQVQARTQELARSLDDLRAAQDRLIQSEKMASLGQLTAGIAHEIKNPLNFVNNFASLSIELLAELKERVATATSSADEATRADIEDIVSTLDTNLAKIGEHGKRADGIVKSMLQHSRSGSGEAQNADLNALIEEALALAYHGLRAQDKSFNITMERDLDPAIGTITAVTQDLTRVFLNLIGNGFYAASKRKRDGGEPDFSPLLKVATRSLGDAVEIRVRDNGIGIPDEIRAKLFTPFFTTKPTGEGTGLGLSISYEIVTRGHGGSIDVESRLGEFTEFIVRLPRALRHTAKSETKEPGR